MQDISREGGKRNGFVCGGHNGGSGCVQRSYVRAWQVVMNDEIDKVASYYLGGENNKI
jgi:hypothetical protein